MLGGGLTVTWRVAAILTSAAEVAVMVEVELAPVCGRSRRTALEAEEGVV